MNGDRGMVACSAMGDFSQLQQIMGSDTQEVPAQTALVKLSLWAETLLSRLMEWAKICSEQSVSDPVVDVENPLSKWARDGLELISSESVAVVGQSLSHLEASIGDRLLEVQGKVVQSLLDLENSLPVCYLMRVMT